MAKYVQQFRYYDEGNIKNSPGSSYRRVFVNGSVFSKYMPVIQLGIQALPGTKFYLNHSNKPIIIGYTGIYELNLEGLATIESIEFDNMSLKTIHENKNASLIVDIIYEQSEGG